MVFKKGDPKTREAASKGGKKGVKHFSTLSWGELTKLSKQANKRSLEVRRRKSEADGLEYEELKWKQSKKPNNT